MDIKIVEIKFGYNETVVLDNLLVLLLFAVGVLNFQEDRYIVIRMFVLEKISGYIISYVHVTK